MASRNPLRKTAPSAPTSTSVIQVFSPCIQPGANGFSTTCAAASAADRVTVIMKSVAAKPSSTRTRIFPDHHGSSRSSMAIDPSPCGLSCATRRYTGSAPSSVSPISTTVASGDSSPAARAAMPGW